MIIDHPVSTVNNIAYTQDYSESGDCEPQVRSIMSPGSYLIDIFSCLTPEGPAAPSSSSPTLRRNRSSSTCSDQIRIRYGKSQTCLTCMDCTRSSSGEAFCRLGGGGVSSNSITEGASRFNSGMIPSAWSTGIGR